MKNISILLGSSGLLGSKVFDYLSKKNINVLGVDKNVSSLKANTKKFNLDITSIKSQNDFDKFLNQILDGYENFYLSLIDCLLIKPSLKNNTIQDTHNALHGYLTTTISIANWFGGYCSSNNINASMVLLSSVKGFYAPKFYHYKNTNMKSAFEYGVSKAGISYAAKDLSVRYNGIVRYNCVAPAGIEGEDHSKLFLKQYSESCLIKPSLIKPIEIAKVINMLISPSCPIIGQTIIIDNGWSLT